MTIQLQLENLLSLINLPLPILAFLAGIITILSPCILPLLPAILAYSSGRGKFRPLAIVAGLTLTFSLMGMAMAVFGRLFYSYDIYIKLIAELVIIVLGLIMLLDLNTFHRLSGIINIDPGKEGIVGGFILGMSLGIVWIPCTGPILTAILMGVLLEGGIIYGGYLLFMYSLGLGVPMLLIAYVVAVSGNKISTISRYDSIIKRSGGAVLILVGLWLVYKNHISLAITIS